VYLVIGSFGLATYVFTAVFVYMSEKDLEHHITGATNGDQILKTYLHAPALPPALPTIDRIARSSRGSVSFEQFRKDGFVKIDLEQKAGTETHDLMKQGGPQDRKKPRMILFN
jgi:hypothetical protein